MSGRFYFTQRENARCKGSAEIRHVIVTSVHLQQHYGKKVFFFFMYELKSFIVIVTQLWLHIFLNFLFSVHAPSCSDNYCAPLIKIHAFSHPVRVKKHKY